MQGILLHEKTQRNEGRIRMGFLKTQGSSYIQKHKAKRVKFTWDSSTHRVVITYKSANK
jgi:hypothetical protein